MLPDLDAVERELGQPLAKTFADIADGLRGVNETQAARLLAAWSGGEIDDDTFHDLLVTLLISGSVAGLTYGDVIGSGYLGRDPVGLELPDDEIRRLGEAAHTTKALLDAPDATTDRLSRLVVGEALHHLQDGTRQAYQAHGVDGYRRGLSASACELCVWLAKKQLDPAGFVYPSDQPMHKHPGCTCTPIPATRPTRKRRKS